MLRPERIDAGQDREHSRLVCIYSLRQPERLDEAALNRPDRVWELGRFATHFASDDEPMAQFTDAVLWPSGAVLSSERGAFATVERASARVGIVPHSGTVLVFSCDLAGDLPHAVVALQETCFRRTTLQVDGAPLVDSLASIVGAGTAVELDREVHQCLFPGGTLTRRLRRRTSRSDFDELALLRLVYREDATFRPAGASMRYPVELNRPERGVAAHGRGVSVVVGAAEHVERAIVLTAIELVACLSCVGRIRREAAGTLERATRELDQTATSANLGLRLEELASWAAGMRKLEVDLSYGVDRYLDNLRVPEIVLTAYRQSLAESLELPRAVESTSRMIERLRRLIEVRRIELSTTQEKEAERRRNANAVAVGYVTLVAIPIGIILAFLGADVSEVGSGKSILDVAFFWHWYALAFVVMLPALVLRWLALRRAD